MILGHLTVTAAVHDVVRRRLWPSIPLSLPLLVLGAYLPDLIDKPLALTIGLNGRGYAHSIVVQALVFGLSFWLLRRHRPVTVTLALGSLIHLLEDWPRLPILVAPLLGPIPHEEVAAFWARVLRYYGEGGIQVWLELAAVVYWLTVGVHWFIRRTGQPARPAATSPRLPRIEARER